MRITENIGEAQRENFTEDREEREEQRKALGSSTLAARRLPLTAVNLAGSLSVRETAAVIAESDLCVGNDTFGLHAAVAVGTPSVVVMGGGDYPRWMPFENAGRHRTAVGEVNCCGCGWRCSRGRYECIETITVEMVCSEIAICLTGRTEPG